MCAGSILSPFPWEDPVKQLEIAETHSTPDSSPLDLKNDSYSSHPIFNIS